LSQSHEAHQLVIRHLKVLEDAPSIANEVDAAVCSAIDRKIESWVASRPDQWQGTYGSITGETYFQPQAWGTDEKNNYYAWYQLAWTEAAKDLNYTLSSLLGAAQQQFGLFFDLDRAWITHLGGKKARAGWKGFLSDNFPKTGLAELGFRIVEDTLFLPIRIAADILVEDYPASIEDALTPALEEFFGKLESAHAQIDALLIDARGHFDGRSDKPGPED
jgi:hypothetical protein